MQTGDEPAGEGWRTRDFAGRGLSQGSPIRPRQAKTAKRNLRVLPHGIRGRAFTVTRTGERSSMSASDTSTSTSPAPEHGRLTMRDGARRLGCSQRHFYDLAYEGEIPTYLAGGHRWVDEQDIDAYIRRCKSRGPQLTRSPDRRAPGRPKPKSKPEATTASAG